MASCTSTGAQYERQSAEYESTVASELGRSLLIDWQHNVIGEVGVRELARALESNTVIKELNVRVCSMARLNEVRERNALPPSLIIICRAMGLETGAYGIWREH